ncbi:hypothetical protein HAX54_030402 [Datura stramonium]|uniref:Uncharacterized protein n=1 Tax=Datura stramonium TaxID=4076 RepID=A0ABS8V9R2_DATST|nr:hypothetical protein [Datura stramonium]
MLSTGEPSIPENGVISSSSSTLKSPILDPLTPQARHIVRLSRKKKKLLLVPLLLFPLIAPSSRNERKRLRSHSTDDGEEEDGSATEAVFYANKLHRVHEAEQSQKEHDDGQNGNIFHYMPTYRTWLSGYISLFQLIR